MIDWNIWTGNGNPQDFLDSANWKDGRIPPPRGAGVFVPAGSRIEAIVPPQGMMLKRLEVEPDPEGTPPEQCTRIRRINEDQFEKIIG